MAQPSPQEGYWAMDDVTSYRSSISVNKLMDLEERESIVTVGCGQV